MEKKMIKCNGLSEERINEIISEYVSLGWKYIGISSGFPADYSWIHLEWSNSEHPIYPGKESSS
jgi:hypothetical protein